MAAFLGPQSGSGLGKNKDIFYFFSIFNVKSGLIVICLVNDLKVKKSSNKDQIKPFAPYSNNFLTQGYVVKPT